MKKHSITLFFIYIFGFLWALSGALPSYIQSSYLGQFVDISFVSLYLVVATSITVVAIIFFPKLITKLSNYRVAILLVVVFIFSNIALYYTNNKWVVLLFFSLNFLVWNLLYISLDVFLEAVSNKKHMGAIRTSFLTVINVAWIISPILMGYITGLNAFGLVYATGAIVLIPALLILLSQYKIFKDHYHYKSRSFVQLFRVFVKNKDLTKIFSVAFLLRFFYFNMVLYIPIYLNQHFGFSWHQLGLMFTIMLLPFLLFQFPAGKIADNYLGEKEILVTGLLIMVASTGSIFFITSTSFIVWTALLFITRVGAALVESMQEVYFFKLVDKTEMDLIDLFRDLRPVAWLAGSLFSFVLLRFLPIEYIFLLLAIVLVFGIYPAMSFKDTK